MPSRPDHPISSGMLRICGIEGHDAAKEKRQNLFRFGRRAAGMSRLRAIHRCKSQASDYFRQRGDPIFINFR